jgi:HPt (histidine-containing phosphotransfer) domain-containing protein
MNPIFDYSGSLRRMDNDRGLFQEMAEMLRRDAPPWLDKLNGAQASGDLATVHRAAHTLKTQAANFGAQRAVLAALEIERVTKDPSAGQPAATKLPPLINELNAAFDELMTALPRDEEAARARQSPAR